MKSSPEKLRLSEFEQIPEGWQPPPKEYGGEDIVNLFSLMLTDETVGMIFF